MRLGIRPDHPFERAALWAGLVPEAVTEVLWAQGLVRVVITALELGVFDALAHGPATVQEVADMTGTSPQGLGPLLAALNGFDYVRRRRGRYRLTRKGRRCVQGDPKSVVTTLRFVENLAFLTRHMEQAVRTGERDNFHHQEVPEGFWERYLRGLAAMAGPVSREIAARVSLGPSCPRLLDVGGGHGMFSVAFCRRYANLQAVVLDLPDAVQVGRTIVAEQGYQDRITFVEGDLRTALWGDGYDVVLLFNVLHNLDAPACAQALKAARRALRPGGTVVVFDGDHAGERKNLDTVAGFSELLFFVLSAAGLWSEERLRHWMDEAGFWRVRRRRLLTFPGSIFLTGTA